MYITDVTEKYCFDREKKIWSKCQFGNKQFIAFYYFNFVGLSKIGVYGFGCRQCLTQEKKNRLEGLYEWFDSEGAQANKIYIEMTDTIVLVVVAIGWVDIIEATEQKDEIMK